MGIDELKMIKELNVSGFSYLDINDIYKHTLPPKAVEIILKWLPKIYAERIGSGEHLIRSLISTEEEFDPSIIIDLFENSDYNSTLKWTMAYVLAIAKTPDISGWIKDQLLNNEPTDERNALLRGVEKKAGFKNLEELISFLKKIYLKYPGENMKKLFLAYGRKSDLLFLELETPKVQIRWRKMMLHMIEKIRNKKNDPVFPMRGNSGVNF